MAGGSRGNRGGRWWKGPTDDGTGGGGSSPTGTLSWSFLQELTPWASSDVLPTLWRAGEYCRLEGVRWWWDGGGGGGVVSRSSSVVVLMSSTILSRLRGAGEYNRLEGVRCWGWDGGGGGSSWSATSGETSVSGFSVAVASISPQSKAPETPMAPETPLLWTACEIEISSRTIRSSGLWSASTDRMARSISSSNDAASPVFGVIGIHMTSLRWST